MNNISFISISDFEGENNAEIIAYLNKVLGHNVNEAIWEWEFNTLTNTVFTLLKEDKKVIATQSMLPVKLKIGQIVYNTAKSETSYLDPAYRGKKLFEQLYTFAINKTVENGTVCVWGFTPAIKAWKNNFLFNVYDGLIKSIEVYVKYYAFETARNNSKNILKSIAKYLVYNSVVIKTKLLGKFRIRNNVELTVCNQLKDSKDFDELNNLIYSRYSNLVSIEFTDVYFKWRILDNPNIQYEFKYFYEIDKLVGYVIYSISNDKLIIADIRFTNKEVLENIILHLSKAGYQHSKLFYWGNDNNAINAEVFSIFKRMGGKTVHDKSRNFVFKTFGKEELAIPGNTENWHINGLWTEGFNI